MTVGPTVPVRVRRELRSVGAPVRTLLRGMSATEWAVPRSGGSMTVATLRKDGAMGVASTAVAETGTGTSSAPASCRS